MPDNVCFVRTIVNEEDGGADAEPEEPQGPAYGGEEGKGGVGEGGEGEGRRGPRRRLPGERKEEGQEEGEAIESSISLNIFVIYFGVGA